MADNKNVIPNGLAASKMRNRMEDKNTLAQKGSMYAGTGVMGENGAAVTTFTPPPSENTLLVKDDTQEGGLNWKNVSDVINNAKTAGQIINTNNADKATTSTNVANIVNDNAADSPVIAFTIGDKSFNKTVNHVENAKAINRSIGSNEEITLLHAEGSTDGFNLKWASGEDAGTLTIETTDDANSQIRFLQNDVQVLQAIDGKCNINGNANSATYTSFTNAGFQTLSLSTGTTDIPFENGKTYIAYFQCQLNGNTYVLSFGTFIYVSTTIFNSPASGYVSLLAWLTVSNGRLHISAQSSSSTSSIGELSGTLYYKEIK